jgi:peptidoglycan/LPS O-acetylase OafA/YrhL
MGKKANTGYMASLDGWRAVSILAVLFDHDYAHFAGAYSLRPWQDFGGNGVVMFFAISGILICSRILEEENVRGRVNLRGFYLRRVFRIQPAAIAYLAAIALLTLMGWIAQDWKYWSGSLFMYRNYQINVLDPRIGAAGFFTGHFWTLAVEEHFYLLLSLFLFFVRSRRLLWLGTAFATSMFLFLLGSKVGLHGAVSGFRQTPYQLHFLVLPAILALLLQRNDVRSWFQMRMKPWVAFASTFIAVAVVLALHQAAFHFTGIAPRILGKLSWVDILLLGWPFWIVATVLHPSSITTKVLELSWMRWVGRLSYSLYLWHILFFRGTWPEEIDQAKSPLLYLTHAPWNYLAAFAAASLSYYFVEKPLMRFGHRLAPPATPGRQDMQDVERAPEVVPAVR